MIQVIDSLSQTLPLMILLLASLVVMMADAFKIKNGLSLIAGLGILISLVVAIPGVGTPQKMQLAFYNMVNVGGFASVVHIFLCFSALMTLFFVDNYFKDKIKQHGDVYTLIMFALIGMSMLASANDLIMVFVGLEVMSISLYVMAAFFKLDGKSNEAGLKYFLLGAFTTGFLLYGMALVYGMTGTTKLNVISEMNVELILEKYHALYYVAFGLILIGFLFKIAAFPFHNWTPDVYSGTPTPLTGFMATGSKLAAFVSFGMLLHDILPANDVKFRTMLAVLALCSMFYGNIIAMQQTNVKRMLAYSSIAHTGYLMLGLIGGGEGLKAVTFYLFTYTFMTIGAFGIISILESKYQNSDLSKWKGLGVKHPLLGVAMAVLMFSLAGIPPFAGFIGKYMVFLSTIKAGFTFYAILGILTSVMGAYYYLRVLVVLFFEKPEGEEEMAVVPAINTPMITVVVIGVLLLILGLYPSPIASYLDIAAGDAGILTIK